MTITLNEKVINSYKSVFGYGGTLLLVFGSSLSTGMSIKLFTAEGNMERIMPNVGKSVRMIMTIYAGYAVIGTILYVIAGMPMFGGY